MICAAFAPLAALVDEAPPKLNETGASQRGMRGE
jgi:hypothetical protein